MRLPEQILSQEVSKAVKRRQWASLIAFRLESSHTFPGLPDWLFLFGGNKFLFVELKAGSTLTKAQKVVHKFFDKFTIPYIVLTKINGGVIVNNEDKTFPTVEDWLTDVIKEHKNVKGN